jgi:hypothetical protein
MCHRNATHAERTFNRRTTMTNAQARHEAEILAELKNAIARSVSHNEIVHITIDGDSGDALAAIDTLIDSDTVEVDYVMCDHEGVDTLDVWASEIGAADGEMLWRLAIRFAG